MEQPQQTSGPLAGIRVVALEQAVAGPFCSRQLADMGADVIKVERPSRGDFARAYDDSLHGVSGYFAWLNRGKRSIVLDLKQPNDCDVLHRLIGRADVFVHNLAPGAVERLGCGYDPATRPRLIWCGISGYGPDGPYRERKAYDLLVQAEAGLTSLTGAPDAPAKAGIAAGDIAAGLYAYSSILAALFRRERTGTGERIDISMLECLTEWIMPALYTYVGEGRILERAGVRHAAVTPYGLYPCSDGLVNFAIQHEGEWRRFCGEVMGCAALANDARFCSNPRRVENRAELDLLIEQHFHTRSRAQVQELLDAAGIASGAFNDVAGVIGHPQLAARARWAEVDSPAGRIPALIPPHNLAHTPAVMGRVPALGEHTQEILEELK
jgi:crotonobetainyl-CoA:carnitine CoA-transferase CaiB-like acyl-CoA transferase